MSHVMEQHVTDAESRAMAIVREAHDKYESIDEAAEWVVNAIERKPKLMAELVRGMLLAWARRQIHYCRSTDYSAIRGSVGLDDDRRSVQAARRLADVVSRGLYKVWRLPTSEKPLGQATLKDLTEAEEHEMRAATLHNARATFYALLKPRLKPGATVEESIPEEEASALAERAKQIVTKGGSE